MFEIGELINSTKGPVPRFELTTFESLKIWLRSGLNLSHLLQNFWIGFSVHLSLWLANKSLQITDSMSLSVVTVSRCLLSPDVYCASQTFWEDSPWQWRQSRNYCSPNRFGWVYMPILSSSEEVFIISRKN